MYTKDGFHKALEQKLGDDAYLLLANGGHKKLTELLTAASLGANGNNTTLSVTVGGTTKTGSVTVPYATVAGSANSVTWANVTSKPSSTGSATQPVYWNGSTFVACTAYGSASVNYANYAAYLPTKYDGGDKSNPQTYFNENIGVRVAMTRYATIGGTTAWFDTLWINGYSGSDVPNMVALTTIRNGTPRAFLSTQSNRATSYGTYYELISTYNIGSQSVNYANSAGAVAWANVSSKPATATRWPTWDEVTSKPSTFAPSSHTHSYLPLAGGTVTGRISRDSGGSWISARDNVIVYTTRTSGEGSDWHPVVGGKTSSGFWTLGSVGGESLMFSYDTDANYNAGNNTSTVLRIPITSGGTLATESYVTSRGYVTSNHNHDSVYAKLASHNNLTASGNEFTFASSGFSGDIYLNYRTAGGTNGNITGYILGNGKGGSLGTIIHSGNIGSQSVNYATSAGSANSVTWANVTSKPSSTGSATQPVYWNGSTFVACTTYANASVNYATSAGSATYAGYLTLTYCDSNTNSGLWNTIKNGSSNTVNNKVNFYTIYNNGGPSTYGEMLEILSYNANHWQPQLWFGAGSGGRIYFRNKDYNVNSFGNWNTIAWTSDITKSAVGLGNVANYDQSKAIKSITRSGTTFTYTALDGTTGTFTQQDNNTWIALSNTAAGYAPKAANGVASSSSNTYYFLGYTGTTVNWYQLPANAFRYEANSDINTFQTYSTANQESPILLKNGTGIGNIRSGTIFAGSVTVNPSTSSLSVGGHLYVSGNLAVTGTGSFGNTITINKDGNALITNSTNANSWIYYRSTKDNTLADRASTGYYSNFAFVANEATYARIGVTDDGTPQYWTDATGTEKYDLIHAGNISSYIGSGNNYYAERLGKYFDRRDVDNPPSFYYDNGFGGAGCVSAEFARVGSAHGYFETRITAIPWWDTSGGRPVQLALANSGAYLRTSADRNTWNSWETIITSARVGYDNGYWDTIPRIGSDGVMEIGKYIDWHESKNNSPDYSCRIECTSGNLYTRSSIYAYGFNTISDRTKKTNIMQFSDHIYRFTYKDTNKDAYGVIAQNVEDMFRDGEEGNMTVNYDSVLSYYVGLLENEVKNLKEENNNLKLKIENLYKLI